MVNKKFALSALVVLGCAAALSTTLTACSKHGSYNECYDGNAFFFPQQPIERHFGVSLVTEGEDGEDGENIVEVDDVPVDGEG